MSREENIENIHSFFDFFNQIKILEVSEFFAEDIKVLLPYHSGLFPSETIGKKNIYESWNNFSKNFSDITFLLEEIMPFEEPNKIAVKLSGKHKFKNKAGSYDNDYFFLFYFDENGKIFELHEYFNPVIAAKTFNMLDKICK
ncbi:MAG: nuclear transport factor 2 family protein [Candidatus Heimdallarchaeota archaeon]|nr:nuclear transport factor 2 family protein [Candidatus Heimdallarchaeota archaeon]MBY8995828.1 nuclear transport factor 2 family protein [Candidatus Heimdallarchaeota archaeon]